MVKLVDLGPGYRNIRDRWPRAPDLANCGCLCALSLRSHMDRKGRLHMERFPDFDLVLSPHKLLAPLRPLRSLFLREKLAQFVGLHPTLVHCV